ncbi:LysR family transcriptional regulator [Sphingomonas histidinilytica]|uniref:LysR family transcriptional regulator n=1 Tax=Rhizorhabdus histidinilytica TaxID=439228 RepID=UPI001ADB4BC2|nr:LysR family transcriptional regulator [Rhizorhabdus histidinilytica]MBO9378867.1 LysR family transcriptional regulator [Rhizorhabdus histidinilytica]
MKDQDTKITLRQMQIFLLAVECRSFVRAAEKLSLTGPAVSMQMARLSESIGADLFYKDGRGVQPTEIATALVPYAERLTETLREAVHVVETLQGRLDNQVRVAMVSTARNFGPQLVAAFGKLFPNVQVDISIANREGVVSQLQDGKADVALMGRPPRRFDVVTRPFAKHPYVLVCHPDHPLRSAKRLRPVDVLPCRFLVREPGSGTRLVHERFFREAGLSLPAAQEMDSNGNIKQAVMANLAVAFISAHTVALEREAGKLHVLDVQGMPQIRDWFVVYPTGRLLGPAASNFADFVETDGPRIMQQIYGDSFGAK